MIEGKWTVRTGHDDIMMAAMIGWLIGEQWHSGGIANSSKLIDIDSDKSMGVKESEDNIAAISKADPDVQGMALKHFNKIMAWTKRGGPPRDRLDGV